LIRPIIVSRMVSRWNNFYNPGGPVLVPAAVDHSIPVDFRPTSILEGTVPEGLLLDDRLCCYCFETILARIRGQSLPILPSIYPHSYQAPLFVTWEKAASQHLRGCIGPLDKCALHPGLQTYAIKSAFEDGRFDPISLDDIGQLECKVSVLHSFEQVSHVYDWVIGLHGIIINFRDNWGTAYNATYLPEIALEHGMNHETAIRELCAKAGYNKGPLSQNMLNRIQVTRYQSGRVKMSASSYLQRIGSDSFHQ